jgi:hypothetical protein
VKIKEQQANRGESKEEQEDSNVERNVINNENHSSKTATRKTAPRKPQKYQMKDRTAQK